MKKIPITPHICCRVPDDWEADDDKNICFRTSDGGLVFIAEREIQKPLRPGVGDGFSALEMVSSQVAEFGGMPRTLTNGRAYLTHSAVIDDRDCRVWHLVNKAGPWHYEILLFTYKPPDGHAANEQVVAILEEAVFSCEFDRDLSAVLPQPVPKKPWWQWW